MMEPRFWEPPQRLYADEATPEWQLGSYRGQNANMHACEAMMAAFDATRDAYLERALMLAESVTQRQAALAGGLVWEHYHADWSPTGTTTETTEPTSSVPGDSRRGT